MVPTGILIASVADISSVTTGVPDLPNLVEPETSKLPYILVEPEISKFL